MQAQDRTELNWEPHCWSHPADILEPEESREDVLRDGALKLLRAMNAAFAHIEHVFRRPNVTVKDVEVAFWQVAYPIGVSCCDDVTMTERAERLGISRALISRSATAFCRAQNIPVSVHMKCEESADSYREARINSIIEANAQADNAT
jgi:hypothetical protein